MYIVTSPNYVSKYRIHLIAMAIIAPDSGIRVNSILKDDSTSVQSLSNGSSNFLSSHCLPWSLYLISLLGLILTKQEEIMSVSTYCTRAEFNLL